MTVDRWAYAAWLAAREEALEAEVTAPAQSGTAFARMIAAQELRMVRTQRQVFPLLGAVLDQVPDD